MEFEFDGPSGILQIAFALLVGLSIVGYGAYSYTTQSAALDSAETVNATVVSTAIETTLWLLGTAIVVTVMFWSRSLLSRAEGAVLVLLNVGNWVFDFVG